MLRNLQGEILATGELSQFGSAGNRMTTELSFRFKDGSRFDQTTVFSQRRMFQLVSYHSIQTGQAFEHNSEMSLNMGTGLVTVRYTDKDGQEKTISENMKLPSDTANGLFTTLLNDIDPSKPKTTLSMVVATPKPRLIKLEISAAEKDPFSIAGVAHTAELYTIRMDLGGITGMIAPVIGKQPPDMRLWMATGKAPSLLRMEAALFIDGPIWQIEVAGPVWPKSEQGQKH